MIRKKPFLWREILRLAIADLRAEMLLTACLIGALVAIVMPLLILAGLRSGIVDSLRDDLIRDPVFREIRPAETKPYSRGFFREIRGLPHVEFVQEGISRGASSVAAIPAGNQESILLDMLPTAFGDPLLTSYDAAVPQE
jgi:putative ABC transport system permease protein